jgi:CysZ protein
MEAMTSDDAAEAPAVPVDSDFVVPPPSSPARRIEIDRPGAFRRFAAGAWHVLGGAGFLLRRPRLWLMAVLPAVLGGAALGAGLIFGVYEVGHVEAAVHSWRPRLPDVLDLIGALGLWAATLAAGVLLGLALVLLVCAPLLEWLERRTEALTGAPTSIAPPRGHDLRRAWVHALYLLPTVPVAFAVALVPFLGPIASGVGVALVLAFQLTAPALERRGLDFAARRRWHGVWRAEMLGFGAAALVLMPLLAPIAVPALAVGAARLVREIELETSEG